jgi:hypothetical protein
MQLDEQFIELVANKIAERAFDKLSERFSHINGLPLILTRDEAKDLLKCGNTKMSELMARSDFPVNRDIGVKIPTHMLIKWIEQNTRWIDENTDYFKKDVI